MKKALQNLALVLISILAGLGIAELVVRLAVPRERWEFKDASADWEPDSLLGWKQKSNYKTVNYDQGLEPITFQTNVDGFRPHNVEPSSVDSSDFVVFLVGNSTVNSRLVPARKTIHYFLDSLLRLKGKPVAVVNASVQGYSTDQALLMIRKYASLYKADWVVYGFCDNDLGGNVTQEAYGMQKPRFEMDGDELSLVPMVRYNEDFDRFRQSSWKDLVVKSALFRLLKPQLITFQARRSDPSSQILVGANGADYYFEPERLGKFDWELLRALVKGMGNESRKLNAHFAFYTHPALESVWLPHIRAAEIKAGKKVHPFALEERLREATAREGILFIPMADYFRNNQSRGPFHLLPKDTHCNGNGYLLQAECIVKQVIDH